MDDPVARDPRCRRAAADRRSRAHPRQFVGARPRPLTPVAARALRPAGDQGERRDVRVEHARARDRGAGARRPGEGRSRCAARSSRSSATTCRRCEPGSPEAARLKDGADRAARVVAVPRGRHRARCRDLHQVAADVGDRPRRRHRPASQVRVEQSGAGDRARREQPRADGRRDARQRRQPARLRRAQRAAAGQGEGQQRVVRDRTVHPAVRRSASASTTCAGASSRCGSTGRTASCSTARARWRRSAATRSISSRMRSGRITSIPTASCSFSAPCSRRPRTDWRRARDSRTWSATSSP